MSNVPPGLNLEQLQRNARDDALYERGRELAERGAVVSAWRRGQLLLAHVQGSEALPYSVTLEPPRSGRRWSVECTCAYNEIYHTLCKHGVAVLYLWITQPERFEVEPTLDEELAGPERTRWVDVIRGSLGADPALARLLALPPERKRPLRRTVNLGPFEEQLRFALLPRHEPARQAQLARSILESAAGYQKVGDHANALRIGSLLAERLIQQQDKTFARLLQTTLSLLELAALDVDWSDEEHGTWTGRLFVWWGEAVDLPAISDRLLDLILHTYRPATEGQVVAWSRAQLRRPVHANQRSQRLWRDRVRTFLLAYYEARGDNGALLDLCWEEGDDRRAALTLARQGDGEEALRLAKSGLGDATTHRMAAELLAEQGEHDAAYRVAEAGLGYQDRGRAALLMWLARRAAQAGTGEPALTYARAAWQERPSIEGYLLLRSLDDSAKTRSAMLRSLESGSDKSLLIEILTAEGLWDEAAALLPESGMRRAELTETLARALSEKEPERAVELLFDLAGLHARSPAGYARAAQALLAAQAVADSQQANTGFASLLQQFKMANRRRSRLLEALVQNGID